MEFKVRTRRTIDNQFIKPTFNRSERLINQNNVYFYKTREGNLSAKFGTRAAALYDLNKFIAVIILQEELANNEALLTTYH